MECGGEAGPAAQEEWVRKQLVEIYTARDPENVGWIDDLMVDPRAVGKEMDLYRKVCAQYKLPAKPCPAAAGGMMMMSPSDDGEETVDEASGDKVDVPVPHDGEEIVDEAWAEYEKRRKTKKVKGASHERKRLKEITESEGPHYDPEHEDYDQYGEPEHVYCKYDPYRDPEHEWYDPYRDPEHEWYDQHYGHGYGSEEGAEREEVAEGEGPEIEEDFDGEWKDDGEQWR